IAYTCSTAHVSLSASKTKVENVSRTVGPPSSSSPTEHAARPSRPATTTRAAAGRSRSGIVTVLPVLVLVFGMLVVDVLIVLVFGSLGVSADDRELVRDDGQVRTVPHLTAGQVDGVDRLGVRVADVGGPVRDCDRRPGLLPLLRLFPGVDHRDGPLQLTGLRVDHVDGAVGAEHQRL